MMWKGQFNAILLLLLVGSCAGSAMIQDWDIFAGTLMLVLFVWFVAKIANVVSSALFGFPLLYATKHKVVQRGDATETRES